jgi:hypothetical protein
VEAPEYNGPTLIKFVWNGISVCYCRERTRKMFLQELISN